VVIGGDDTELLARLFRWLTALIAERGERFARAGASTLTEYRERSGDRAEPRIMVLIDGAQVFRQRHEARSGLWEQLLAAAADGRASGIHFCLAADRPSSLPGALNSLLQRRIYLRMSTEDYGLLGLGGSALEATAPPGRGHLDGHEIQVGVLGGDPSIAAQARALRDLAHRAAADLPPPHRIEPLPDYQPLEVLPPNIDGDPVIGLADDTMAPVSVRIRSTFLIAGPPGSGRTTALATVAMAALRSGRYGAAVYFGPRTTEPPPWLSWTAAATDPGDVARLAATVAQALDEPDAVRTLVVVESLPDVATGLAETELYRLAQKCVAAGHALVTDTGLNAKMYSDLAQLIKGQRQGIVLHPGGPADGQNLLFTNTPATGRERRPGRGYLISDGAARLVQVATADPAAAVLTRRRTGRAALETPVPNA
jgi:S-DNA-T family DNA segregation ATPase FtsK/SpoIIIE